MQTDAREVFELEKESEATLALYGLKRGQSEGFGWQCLVARRLAERGVRFIELVDGSSSNNWDQHGDMAEHAGHAKNIDQPIAGLLRDLKARGLLDDTLVVWTTEFGRTPGVDGTKGRGHHSACFSSWLAGGGVKGGLAYGATDEIASTVVENKVHVHDFHATILHLLGIDHEKLTYRHGGRDYRLTDVFGNVVHDILA
jgi:membrane-anchored protein YejM (alkaline phosphatase superfamily)